ncbi:MotA/TolQ/ExbB proton channel family protein [Mesorhizobium hawassense]|nr:MotA/TolQ/ExbB proton channel family protein [Mesorhizobium hawassense]
MVDIYSRENAPRQKPWPSPVAQKLWPEQAADLGSHAVGRRLSDTHSDHGAPKAFLSRFIVLQAIGTAGIVGLWAVGVAGKPFAGNNAFLCWLIAAIGALGILCVFFRRWRDVDWLATHVVRIGLLGTVVGLIVAFSAARAGGTADPNAIRSMIGSVIDGMYVALYATLLGIATNLWLKINLRLLGNFDG